MKHIKLIICTLLIFCMSVAGFAEAKSRGASFKSGFSSQKRNTAKPAATYNTPVPEQKKTAFGSFGTADAKNRQEPIDYALAFPSWRRVGFSRIPVAKPREKFSGCGCAWR